MRLGPQQQEASVEAFRAQRLSGLGTGKARAEIPVASFGKNDKGLVVAITKAEIDAQATAKAGKTGKTEN